MPESGPAAVNLRTEYLTDPIGIGARRPRLSWEMASRRRGSTQQAYRITAGSDPGADDRWDTGWVESRVTSGIAYDGNRVGARERVWWRVMLRDNTGVESPWSDAAFWETGLLSSESISASGEERSEWRARWVSHPKLAVDPEVGKAREWDGLVPAPHFRTAFDVAGEVTRARLYVTARGVYEAHVNGAVVGDHTLDPGWTDYNRRIQYQAFDVTDRLRDGENVLGAVVAPGWYAGYVGFGPQCRHYGATPQLLMELHLELADGTGQVVASGEEWLAGTGAVRYGDLLFGEHHDARHHPHGWDGPGFDASGWQAVAVGAVGAVPIVASVAEPVRELDRIEPVSVSEHQPGVWIVDLGQNIAGRVHMAARGEAGTEIRLRHGERLNPDGSLYTENLRGEFQEDTFVLAGTGDDETFAPRFTWHGFQFVEVTGYPGELTPEAITGRFVGSDTTPVGGFTCSDELINQLQRNIVWGQRDNFLSIPTDCPQRDERLGWLGDAQAFVGTAVGNMDVAAFFTKWLQDLRDGQAVEGPYPDVAPRLCDLADGAPAWADAGVIVPWTIWKTYGDTRLIERNWLSMVRWMDWLERENPNLLWQRGRHHDFGDWLSVGADTPKELIGTAYFAWDARLMAEMARAIGRDADGDRFDELFRRVATAFIDAYVHEDGTIAGNTQTVYCLALHFGLLPDELRPRAAKQLVADLEARDWRITTGFVGVSYICHVLTNAGYPEVAYRLLLREGFPSWKYSIRHGATTIWERWDGWTEERGFQDVGMNSFNHYTLGSVGEWLRRGVAGIDTNGPGYRSVSIAPVMDRSLDHVEGRFHAITGEIRSKWQWTDGGYRVEVTIPANVDARIVLPGSADGQVAESGGMPEAAEGVANVDRRDGDTVVSAGSGSYVFQVTT